MLLITNVTAITVDPQRRIIIEAAIAIEDSRILDMGKTVELEARYPDAERLDGRGMIALPGFIDTHVHSDQALLRSVADEVPWRPFLDDYIWPILTKRTTEEALISLKLCMLEMIKSGTTCFVDSMVHVRYDFDQLAQTVVDAGMRAVLAKYVIPQAAFEFEASQIDTGTLQNEDESMRAAQRNISDWNGAAGGRLQVWYGPLVPRDPDTCEPDFYKRVADKAAQQGVGITIHLAAEKDDIAFFQNTFGLRPGEFARRHCLAGSNVLLIGGCWFSNEEIYLLAERGTKLSHSPSANMKMASGVANVPEMLEAGMTVALGCDAAANNNCHDMVREMKAACLLHNITTRRANALTAEEALEMATIQGAQAIGREADLGSLEIGKQADLILIDLQHPHTMPIFDPVANLVYAAHGGNVDTVMVAGRILMQNRNVLALDDETILSRAQVMGHELLERAGIQVMSNWPVV